MVAFSVRAGFRVFPGLENFTKPLVRLEVSDNIAIVGLSFAFMVGSALNAFLLGRGLFRPNGNEEAKTLLDSGRKIAAMACAMSLAAYIVLQLSPFLSRSLFYKEVTLETFAGVFLHAALAIIAAGAVGIGAARALRIREYQEIRDALSSRLTKKDILQPELEHL